MWGLFLHHELHENSSSQNPAFLHGLHRKAYDSNVVQITAHVYYPGLTHLKQEFLLGPPLTITTSRLVEKYACFYENENAESPSARKRRKEKCYHETLGRTNLDFDRRVQEDVTKCI